LADAGENRLTSSATTATSSPATSPRSTSAATSTSSGAARTCHHRRLQRLSEGDRDEIDAIPGVVESAVIGVPHPDFGEGVTAVVGAHAWLGS
jgi:hypothetical protein